MQHTRRFRNAALHYLREVGPPLVMAVTAVVLSRWIDSLWGQSDDAYITYQYARRLAAGAGFTYSPGAPATYGATTALWTLLLALLCKFGAAPHVAALWAASFLHAAAAVLLYRCVRPLAGQLAASFAGLTWATALAVFFRVDGMETPLLVVLLLLSWLALQERWRPWTIGLLTGLLLLTRPDAALVALAIWIAHGRLRTEWRPVLLLAGLVYLPWAVYAFDAFGDVIPLSVRAKAAVAPLALSEASLDEALRTYFPLTYGAALAGLLTAVAALGAVPVWRERPQLRPLLLWLPAYALALRALGYPNFSWYYAPLLPFGVILVAAGLTRVAPHPAFRAVLAVALLSGLIWCGSTGTRSLRRPLTWQKAHRELAQELRRRAHPGDVAAAEEVGELAYWSGARILDLRGLTSPEVLPWVQSGRFDSPIQRFHPRFVMGVNMPGRWKDHYQVVASRRYLGPPGTRCFLWQRLPDSGPTKTARRLPGGS